MRVKDKQSIEKYLSKISIIVFERTQALDRLWFNEYGYYPDFDWHADIMRDERIELLYQKINRIINKNRYHKHSNEYLNE